MTDAGVAMYRAFNYIKTQDSPAKALSFITDVRSSISSAQSNFLCWDIYRELSQPSFHTSILSTNNNLNCFTLIEFCISYQTFHLSVLLFVTYAIFLSEFLQVGSRPLVVASWTNAIFVFNIGLWTIWEWGAHSRTHSRGIAPNISFSWWDIWLWIWWRKNGILIVYQCLLSFPSFSECLFVRLCVFCYCTLS